MFTSVCVLVRHLSLVLVFFGIARFSSMKTQEVTYESCSFGLRVVATRWRYWRQFVSWYRRWCVEDIVKRHFFVSGSVLFLGLPHRLLIELMKWSLFSIWQWSKERCGIFVKLYKKLFGDAHVQPVEVFDTSNVLKLAVRMLLLDGVLIYHDLLFYKLTVELWSAQCLLERKHWRCNFVQENTSCVMQEWITVCLYRSGNVNVQSVWKGPNWPCFCSSGLLPCPCITVGDVDGLI